jgi:dTMP kinase
MSPGHLFVLEGPDAVGKTRLASELTRAFVSERFRVRHLAFPGRDPGTLGGLVYELHHNVKALGTTNLPPVSLQLLHVAAHIDAIENVIVPHISAGGVVVLERYWWSTWVYGKVSGIADEYLTMITNLASRSWPIRPTAIFLVERSATDRAVGNPSEHSTLSDLYSRLAHDERNACPVVKIANNGSVEAATAAIMGVAAQLMNDTKLSIRPSIWLQSEG